MFFRVPTFYKKFNCLADKCSETCCQGWEIDVDEKTQQRYGEVPGEFGEVLKAGIKDGHIALTKDNYCPFLTKNNLCGVYVNVGPDAMCDICREHPRFVEVYGDLREQGVGLACEEAVRLLLTETGPLQFECGKDSEPGEGIPEDALEARDAILEEREQMFMLLAAEEIPLKERFHKLLDFAVEVSGCDEGAEVDGDEIPADNDGDEIPADENSEKLTDVALLETWKEVLMEGESLGKNWDNAVALLRKKEFVPEHSTCGTAFLTSEESSRTVAYALFRYYEKSLFDGDSLSKVQFSLFFVLVLLAFGDEIADAYPTFASPSKDLNRKVDAIKLLSKQVEYSDEIMDILADAFCDNPAFSVESFHRVIDLVL